MEWDGLLVGRMNVALQRRVKRSLSYKYHKDQTWLSARRHP